MSELDLQRQIANLDARLSRIEANGGITPLVAPFLGLSELRGLWSMSSVNEGGNIYDLSGQARTLTNTGTASRGVNNTYAPYIGLNGTTQCLTRADEAGLDVTGACTIMAWFYTTTTAAAQGVCTKWGAAGQQSFGIQILGTGELRSIITTDGSTLFTSNNSAVLTANAWYLASLRFTPSTSLAIYLNGVQANINTTAVPATIFNSTAAFEVGRLNAAQYLSGGVSVVALCAAALSDAVISSVYQQTRGWFGV